MQRTKLRVYQSPWREVRSTFQTFKTVWMAASTKTYADYMISLFFHGLKILAIKKHLAKRWVQCFSQTVYNINNHNSCTSFVTFFCHGNIFVPMFLSFYNLFQSNEEEASAKDLCTFAWTLFYPACALPVDRSFYFLLLFVLQSLYWCWLFCQLLFLCTISISKIRISNAMMYLPFEFLSKTQRCKNIYNEVCWGIYHQKVPG